MRAGRAAAGPATARSVAAVLAAGLIGLAGCATAGTAGGTAAGGTAAGGTAAGGTAAPGAAAGGRADRTGGGVVVRGRLVMEGGPLGPGGQQPGVRPIPGTVTFSDGRRRVTAGVPASGRFRVRLAAGTYRAVATTPNITGPGDQHGTCPDPDPVRVQGPAVSVIIACVVP
jgi:hypothetical protein